MDNFHIDITSEGKEDLLRALQIVCTQHKYASHWSATERGLVLFWSKPDPIPREVWQLPSHATAGDVIQYRGKVYAYQRQDSDGGDPSSWKWEELRTIAPTEVHPFAFKHKAEDLAPFVAGWLSETNYGSKPDIDGSCAKGWHLFVDNYGCVNDFMGRKLAYSMCCIRPVWAEHHK